MEGWLNPDSPLLIYITNFVILLLILPGLSSVYFSCEMIFQANFVRASNVVNYKHK